MKKRTEIILWIGCVICALLIGLFCNARAQDRGGKLTGEVRGLDEEAKIVHMIENARTFDYRVWVAFQYAVSAIDKRDDMRKDFTKPDRVIAMNAAVVTELRRAILCQDAPKWAKDMRQDTIWWSTNVLDPGQYPWHWEPPTHTNGPGIDWRKVDERDYP